MLSKIIIENFKSIKNRVEIPISEITLLFGPNSAGKSSVLQALHVIRELIDSDNIDVSHVYSDVFGINLGGFRNYVYNKDLSNKITLGIEFQYGLSDHLFTGDFYYEMFDASEPEEMWSDDGFEIKRLKSRVGHAESIIETELGKVCLSEVNYNPKCESFQIEFVISWDKNKAAAYIEAYKVIINDNILAVAEFCDAEVSEDGAELSTFNIDHPVYLASWKGQEFNLMHSFLMTLGVSDPKSHLTQHPPMKTGISDSWSSFSDSAVIFHQTSQLFSPLEEVYIPDIRIPTDFISLLSQTNKIKKAKNSQEEFLRVREEYQRQQKIVQSFAYQLFVEVFHRCFLRPFAYIKKNSALGMRHIGPIRSKMPGSDMKKFLDEHNRWLDGTAAWKQIITASEEFITRISDNMNSIEIGYTPKISSYRSVSTERISESDLDALVEKDLVDELKRLLMNSPIEKRVSIVPENNRDLELLPHEVGEGVSQVLPIVVALSDQYGGILCVEQPELHVHPALQVKLSDLFIQGINVASGSCLIETHSEHLILRLLRRIRQTTDHELPSEKLSLEPDQLSVVYLENKDGNTTATHLRIDKEGEFIDRWPTGFFEEREEELFG